MKTLPTVKKEYSATGLNRAKVALKIMYQLLQKLHYYRSLNRAKVALKRRLVQHHAISFYRLNRAKVALKIGSLL